MTSLQQFPYFLTQTEFSKDIFTFYLQSVFLPFISFVDITIFLIRFSVIYLSEKVILRKIIYTEIIYISMLKIL